MADVVGIARRLTGRISVASVVGVAVWTGSCGGSYPAAIPRGSSRPAVSAPAGPAADASSTTLPSGPIALADPSCPERILASLTEAQRVGQLFMIGEPLPTPDGPALQAIKERAVGGVILYGNSRAPLTAIRTLTDRIRTVAAPSVPAVGLYVATDQEGGQIQQLSGPGFDAIPAATSQGRTDPGQLQAHAQRWAAQLAQAGVNVDLAPVLDVVPAAFEAVNQPISHLQRQLGRDSATVAAHGTALVRGLQAGGVAATLKHFPGLGRVAGNTDTTAGVADTVTTRHDRFLSPFAAGIQAGAQFVMASLATYRQIDPANRAVFSSIIINGVLRGDLGFRGLVVSDDLGSSQQVLDLLPGQRAISFLGAGGTVVLVVKPTSVVAPMVAAVLAEAGANPVFRQLVDSDALAVLTAKQTAGLLDCR